MKNGEMVDFNTLQDITKDTINKFREQWKTMAKRGGWYTEPFNIQAFIHEDGTVFDVVAHQGMADEKQDIIIVDNNYNDLD